MKKPKPNEYKLIRGSWISTAPVLPGVWRRKEGGHQVRGRAIDPRTGKMREVWASLPVSDEVTALKYLKDEIAQIRAGLVKEVTQKVHFSTYARNVFERKVQAGDLKSVATHRKWENILEHLIRSPLGKLYVDKLRTSDMLQWKADFARKIASDEYAPTTGNLHRAVLRVIMAEAKLEFGLPSNPAADVPPFDTSRHRVYSEEEPNSLEVEELVKFLACMRTKYPQHYAMTYTGFATGLRPSSLRPLRREGKTPDVLWAKNVLLIRRSNSRGDFVMESTKTARDQRIVVPDELMQVLKWHVETQLQYPTQQESELLFPSELGGFRARSALDKPFRDVAKEIGLTKHITPRAMRRTFQDVARFAGLPDVVTRSISGHATEEMQMHYSTVAGAEQQAGLAKVLKLFKGQTPAPKTGGEESGEGAFQVVRK